MLSRLMLVPCGALPVASPMHGPWLIIRPFDDDCMVIGMVVSVDVTIRDHRCMNIQGPSVRGLLLSDHLDAVVFA